MTDRPKSDDPSVRRHVPAPVVTLDALIAAERSVADAPEASVEDTQPDSATPVPEIGGRREGLEPTRYGDWEKKGRCIDF